MKVAQFSSINNYAEWVHGFHRYEVIFIDLTVYNEMLILTYKDGDLYE